MSGITVRGGLRKAVQRAMYDGNLILIQDLHKFLGSPKADEPTPRWVADIIRDLLASPQRDRRLSFSPSQLHTCERRQMFQYAGVERMAVLQSELMNLFRDGTWRHLRLQATLLHAGLVDDVEVSISKPEKRLTGSIDGNGNDSKGEWLLEIKGINGFQFEKLLDVNAQPLWAHLYQGAGYAMASEVMRVVFLYECKNTQRLKEFDVDYSTPEYAPYLAEVTEIVERLNRYVDTQDLPPVLTGDDAAECDKCPFNHVCANTSALDVHTLIQEEHVRRGVLPKKKVKKPRVTKKEVDPLPEDTDTAEETEYVRSNLSESELPWRLRKHR